MNHPQENPISKTTTLRGTVKQIYLFTYTYTNSSVFILDLVFSDLSKIHEIHRKINDAIKTINRKNEYRKIEITLDKFFLKQL